jgi:hypothetical protein
MTWPARDDCDRLSARPIGPRAWPRQAGPAGGFFVLIDPW